MTNKFSYFLTLLLFLSLPSVAANIIPNVSVSATNSNGIMISSNIVNYSGLSNISVNATHDNPSNGSTMWCSNTMFISDPKLTFDLKQVYNLKELYVWNFNLPSYLDRGLKNIAIEYSSDNSEWFPVPAPSNPGYEADSSYPFQFARATGVSALSATNLNDGMHTPVNLSGIQARYVRFVISKTVGVGNWGATSFGLSEVLFTTDDDVNDSYTVRVTPGNIVNTCGNLLFGGCQNPSFPHSQTILPLLAEAGFNAVRCDMWLETVLPQNITYDDYINNVNDVQNPDTWDFSNLELAVLAKKNGMNVMMIISYCPAWLSWNGKTNGIPKDLDVYADIVRKVYSRYYRYIDQVEIYNEPGYFMTTENSPYTSVGAALADIYMTCVKVVRDITPNMPMGGTSVVTHSDGGVGGSTNRDFFADERINKDNFNFYSHHVYGDYGISTVKETVTRVKNELNKFGYGDLPIWFTEWSYSINNAADSIYYIGTRSHTFVGNCLLNWMRDGLTGAHHWNYLQAVAENGKESGVSTDAHGMYAWNARTKEGSLLPKSYVFKLLSKTLGLGIGENSIVQTENEAGDLLNIVSFINADGQKSTVIVNENSVPLKIKITYANSSFSGLKKYTVTYSENGEFEENVSHSSSGNGIDCTITVKPMSVTGIRCIQ